MIGFARRLGWQLRQLQAALSPMRQRGLSLAGALLWFLPAAVLLRGWRRLAQALNARLLDRPLNGPRFAVFQQRLPASVVPRAYVIVMPHTLHFLLPCLALLHGRVPLVLVANGAQAWERALLRQRLPDLPMFRLCTLPGTSLAHGNTVSLLLRHHRGDFLIVDHDAYVFDAGLLPRLTPVDHECAVGVFAQHSRATGADYPLTHLLALRAEPLRQLMRRHGVDARLYHRAPARLADLLARVGLGPGRYLKDYQGFHDTAHVLLGLALAEGWCWRIEPVDPAAPVMHVGGTSLGSHHTKSLFALYVHLRFLDLLDDPLIRRRYAHLTRPLRSAAEALQRRQQADPAWKALPVVDELMQRLQAAGAGHGFRAQAPTPAPV